MWEKHGMYFEKPNKSFVAFTMFAPLSLIIATTFSMPHLSKHFDISFEIQSVYD